MKSKWRHGMTYVYSQQVHRVAHCDMNECQWRFQHRKGHEYANVIFQWTIRHLKQVQPILCGPTFSQLWSVRQDNKLFKKRFIPCTRWGMTEMSNTNGWPYLTTNDHGNFLHVHSVRNWGIWFNNSELYGFWIHFDWHLNCITLNTQTQQLCAYKLDHSYLSI